MRFSALSVPLAILVLLAMPLSAYAAGTADPIEGSWLTQQGKSMSIAPCDEGICIFFERNARSSEKLGHLAQKSHGHYEGVIRPSPSDAELEAKADLRGNTLILTSCPFKGVCVNLNWTRR